MYNGLTALTQLGDLTPFDFYASPYNSMATTYCPIATGDRIKVTVVNPQTAASIISAQFSVSTLSATPYQVKTKLTCES